MVISSPHPLSLSAPSSRSHHPGTPTAYLFPPKSLQNRTNPCTRVLHARAACISRTQNRDGPVYSSIREEEFPGSRLAGGGKTTVPMPVLVCMYVFMHARRYMCVCMYICMYIYVCVLSVCADVRERCVRDHGWRGYETDVWMPMLAFTLFFWVCVCVCLSQGMKKGVVIPVYVCMHVCMYVCMHARAYIYVCMYPCSLYVSNSGSEGIHCSGTC